jgi:hypothetical protein
VTTLDPAAIRMALERQDADLAPISRELSALAVFPPRLRSDEWRGEAASACERLEERMRRQLRAADAAVHAARNHTRSALAELGGAP